jgi:hypothetical protein
MDTPAVVTCAVCGHEATVSGLAIATVDGEGAPS